MPRHLTLTDHGLLELLAGLALIGGPPAVGLGPVALMVVAPAAARRLVRHRGCPIVEGDRSTREPAEAVSPATCGCSSRPGS